MTTHARFVFFQKQIDKTDIHVDRLTDVRIEVLMFACILSYVKSRMVVMQRMTTNARCVITPCSIGSKNRQIDR